MAVVETRVSLWEALAGRAPGQPAGPAEPDLWSAVADRLNPARARPRVRAGIEEAHLVNVRGVRYVMLRSPDDHRACAYLRLAPEEWDLAQLMDGTRTVARLVAEFARLTGRLAPDQVTRVVADLAGNRMLHELPVDAYRPLGRVRRRPWPLRLGAFLLAAARGRRVVLASVDPLVGGLYRAGGRLLFTRTAAVAMAALAVAGLGLFGWTWATGGQSVFLAGHSYGWGAAALLGLNCVALASHELGHALATRHAGRRVPAAGFLIYFGIPSVFVDTTDVWMAGRRARLLATAAGPATGLVLAGAAQVAALVYPPFAPWAFKLAFAWYLNALFNLNPFLALDGYYLLMDWLEIPNLRARGMAWVLGWLSWPGRRGRWPRPVRLGRLDREGRMIALYGLLAVAWLAIAANLALRVYTDRVGGLALGLWRVGWPARLLLGVVVAALLAPVGYVLAGWCRRALHGVVRRLRERRRDADRPRRLAALRAGVLGALPGPALADLARQAAWVHPRPGQPLLRAGTAPDQVYLVVDGALEGRAPGDPAGTVRERVGPGGVVGLSAVLTGAAPRLTWHTAGTTLLGLPGGAVAGAVRAVPAGGADGADPAGGADGTDPAGGADGTGLAGGGDGAHPVRADDGAHRVHGDAGRPGPARLYAVGLAELFAGAPALAGLTAEDRLGLMRRTRSVDLAPNALLRLSGTDAAVVASGILMADDGAELRPGDLAGPALEDGPVAVARTPARVWVVPAVAGLPLLLGARPAEVAAAAAGRAPVAGAHPAGGYPPLSVPPGPPPPVDEEVDRRLEGRLRWLLVLLLLLALLLTAANLLPGPAWAEMPQDRALLAVQRGSVAAVVDAVPVTLRAGDRAYLGSGDGFTVAVRSRATLTFRGGGRAVLCAGTAGLLGPMAGAGRPVLPSAELGLYAGRLVADTGGSPAFRPLRLSVDTAAGRVAAEGAATFAASPAGAAVARGRVTLGGVPVTPVDAGLGCGGGTGAPTAAAAGPTPVPTAAQPPVASATQPPVAGLGTLPPSSPSAAPTSAAPVLPTAPPPLTTSPTPAGTPSPSPSPSPGTSTPAPNRPPVLTWVQDPGGSLSQLYYGTACPAGGATALGYLVTVTDDRDPATALTVTLSWSGKYQSGSRAMTLRAGNTFYGQLGPFDFADTNGQGDYLLITATAVDTGKAVGRVGGTPVTLDSCIIIG